MIGKLFILWVIISGNHIKNCIGKIYLSLNYSYYSRLNSYLTNKTKKNIIE